MAGDTSWLDSMPEYYDRCLGPALFGPHARHVAALAAARSPQSVLELAAGTGIVTTELVRALPGARITATDLNPAMVTWAQARVTGASWRAADAQQLPFPDGSFDLVLCQFGVMFLPDKPGAFAEMARVLTAGGSLLFAVWDRIETSQFEAAVTAELEAMFPDDPPDFLSRIPHGYHDADQIRRDVSAGGLVVENIERAVLHGTAPSARTIAEGFCYGTPLRFALQERGNLDAFYEELGDRLTRRLGDGPLHGESAAYVVTARRP